jgi:hypothetical protein
MMNQLVIFFSFGTHKSASALRSFYFTAVIASVGLVSFFKAKSFYTLSLF